MAGAPPVTPAIEPADDVAIEAARQHRIRTRFMLLLGTMVAVAAVLWALQLRGVPAVRQHLDVPWWGLVAPLALSGFFIVSFEVRRAAHSLELTDLPFVIGLFALPPEIAVLVRVISIVPPFVVRYRRDSRKLAFNLANQLIEGTASAAVFVAIGPHTDPLDPRGWAAALVACIVGLVAGSMSVGAVMVIHEGPIRLRQLVEALPVGAVMQAASCSFGVLSVIVLDRTRAGAGPLLAIALLAGVVYRAYIGMQKRHGSLESLYGFGRDVSSAPDLHAVARSMLEHARQLLRSEHCELTLLSWPGSPGAVCVSGGFGGLDVRDVEYIRDDWAVHQVVNDGPPLLLTARDRDPHRRRYLDERGRREMLVAPLPGDSGVIGAIAVADRFAQFRTYDEDDLRLLETLARQGAVSLQNSRLIERLRHDARHDSLTGLGNRQLLEEVLGELLAARIPAAVLLLDLDRFKEVNDTLGHRVGDQLLCEVSHRLIEACPEDAVISRLGGDEFAIVLSGAEAGPAVAVGERICSALSRPLMLEALSVSTEASIGIALAPHHGDSPTLLLQRADVAMYLAKGEHIAAALYDPERDENSRRRLALVPELRRAIEGDSSGGQITLHYQPKVDLSTGRIVGVEALARWLHPHHGMLRPDEFIPLAESTNLIRGLTTVVLDLALAECRRWVEGGHDLSIAVNLSAQSLRDEAVLDDIATALARHGLSPHRLIVEITESSIMRDPERAAARLETLRRRGVQVSVDDFGTGYSALAYLTGLPADEVKIDKSFVMQMSNDPRLAAVVHSVVALGSDLGLRIVAEGVEDVEAWNALAAMGCSVAQGFLLSRPIPAAEFTEWLHSWQPAVSGVVPMQRPSSERNAGIRLIR